MRRLPLLLVLLLLAIAAPVSAGDLMLKSTVTTSGGPKGGTREETEWLTPTRIVNDSADERSIIDLDAKTVTIADKAQRTWFTMDMNALRKQAEDVQTQMQKLPPEAQQMMEKMMGKPGEATLQPSGKTEKIAGYEAKEYVIKAGVMSGSLWVTDALQPPFDVAKWQEYAASAMMPKGPGRGIAEAFAKIRGIPLRRTMTASGLGGQGQTFTSSMEVVEVKQTSPPPDVLKVPDGYKQTKPPTDE
jgi:hypothetical protein